MMMICREGGVGFFPAVVVVLVESRVRRAWGGGGVGDGEGEGESGRDFLQRYEQVNRR